MATDSIPDNYREWNEAVTTYLRIDRPGITDAEAYAASDRLSQVSNELMARPVRSLADLALLAAIAVHWNAATCPEDGRYPDSVIAGNCEEDFDERSLAYLVRAVLTLAGLELDGEGRIVSGKE